VNRDAGEIRDIDAALKRVAAGTFGLCIGCGASIAPQRLQAYPTAKRCLNCQRQHEKTRAVPPIPKL
jgi:RNA polymerase-binding transcription factor DksA